VTPRVVVVGLGPAGDDLVSAGTLEQIGRHPTRFVRTTRHPSAHLVGDGARSFDELYEAASTMSEVYEGIVESLVAAAGEHGSVLYAVPGSPVVAEHTVQLLLEDDRVEVEVHAALSFLDLTWVRLGVDPVAAGVRVVDGHRFAVDAAGERGPLLVAQCDRASVLSDIKLAVDDPPHDPVVVLQRLGDRDERITEVAWADLDRVVEPDHLTSLWIPELAAPVAVELVSLVELVAQLRAECPWDREQTHRSLTGFLVEETYEVVDVLDRMPEDAGGLDIDPLEGDVADVLYSELEEELGDLLFQIVFHTRLASEAGRFTLVDVARAIHRKLVERHPHVFGDVDVHGDAREVERNWERIKASRTDRQSIFDGLPTALPALAYTAALVERARSAGLEVVVDGFDGDVGAAEMVEQGLMRTVVAAVDLGLEPEELLRRLARRVENELRSREGSAPHGG
jgi:tetrapyrrole methylase family protein / MazG family protein